MTRLQLGLFWPVATLRITFSGNSYSAMLYLYERFVNTVDATHATRREARANFSFWYASLPYGFALSLSQHLAALIS